MRTAQRMILVLIITLAMKPSAGVQAAQTPSRPTQLSNTRVASCIVKITADPGVIALSPDIVESLLYSSRVGLRAARQVLDIDTPDNLDELIEIQWLDASPAGPRPSANMAYEPVQGPYSREMMAEMERIYGAEYMKQMGARPEDRKEPDRAGRTERSPQRETRRVPSPGRGGGPRIEPDGTQTVVVQLSVHLPENVRPAAGEFMLDVANNLRMALMDAYRDYASVLQGHMESTRAQWDDAARELETIRAQSPQSGDKPKVEVDVRSLSDYQSLLSSTIREFELKLAGMQARKEAIGQQIAETRNRAETQLSGDAVTNELMRIIEINENNLDSLRKQVDSGRASTADLAQANENLARARIELAKRREELARQAGGGQLDDLNRQLATTTIEMAGDEAELVTRKKQLQEVQEQLARATTFDPQAARTRMVQNAMEVLEDRIAELQTRLANLQSPTLMVIGAN